MMPDVRTTPFHATRLQDRSASFDGRDLHELLTVDEVAALLKVSKSWVYEHTRSRGTPRSERLPYHQDWKIPAFRSARRAGVSREEMPNNVIRFPTTATINPRLNHEEPTRGKGVSRMARTKRQYGSGCLLKRGRGWAIRWRELEIAPDGTTKKALHYEALGKISRGEATEILAQKARRPAPARSRRGRVWRSGRLSNEWKTTVLPMYKHSTQKNHRHIAEKHLVPRFGDHGDL